MTETIIVNEFKLQLVLLVLFFLGFFIGRWSKT